MDRSATNLDPAMGPGFRDEIHRIGTLLVSEVELDRIVQRLTDEATAVCGAKFGAFFYNVVRPDGESYSLYTLTGVPREAFADMGLPRNTALFAPTFAGESVVRLSDVTRDPRYGLSAPHLGMPKGHIPVRSYLAVPVSSRSGEILGGLFFGHPEPDIFTSQHEEILTGVACQAAIAIDNARLLRSAREAKEVLARALAAEQAARRAQAETEQRLRLALESAEIGIWDLDPRTGRLDWDARCKALSGLSPEADVDFDVLLSGLHPGDRERVMGVIDRSLDPAGSGEYEAEYRTIGIEDRALRWIAAQGRTFFEAGRALRCIGTMRDITARKNAEKALLQSARRAQLGAEVGAAMAGRSPLDEQLRRCAQAIVGNLDVAFARIWTLEEATQTLVLRASMGIYTHIDGPHSRVPVGSLKIGLIARDRRPHLSNDVIHDGLVGDSAWAQREGMVAFAGYPLIVDDRVVGVMAMFSQYPLGPEALHALAYVADAIAVGIDRKSSEEQRMALLVREQAALAQAEAHRARLHTLLMQAPAIIAIFRGPDHVFELANAGYRRVVGEDRELTGRSIREAVSELALGAIFPVLDRVYSSGEAFVGTEMRSAFGRVIDGRREEEGFYNVVFQPTFDASGHVDGVLQVSFDVTDHVRARRRAERLTEQLRKSEQRYRSVIEATAKTVWITSPEGEMLDEQPGWARLTGQTFEEYQGRGWLAAIHPEDLPRTLALWDGCLSSGEVFIREHRIRRHDGEWRYFSANSAPVREEDGSIREWFGVQTDVTEKKLIEVERESLIAALRRSNEDLDQFAYVTSHDLKAPLRGIANLSQWVEEDLAGKISDEGREHMRLLRGRVHRLEALINGILSYSRAGRTHDAPESVNLWKLVREVVELLAPATEDIVVIPADLPTIQTERVPLQQVLLNLISNALKHAAKTDPKVIVTCSATGDGYSFMVRDNGSGIAPEFHKRIWVIFQTLEPRDKVEATGIGLSIVKKIVESRGGRVWIDSALGAGAAFHFFWPNRAKASP